MNKKIGVIGTGVISSAIVTGFCEKNTGDAFFLSPRNAVNSANLAACYNNVAVCATNQEVIDKSDWLIISLLPQKRKEILSDLKFSDDKRIINLIPYPVLSEIGEMICKYKSIARVIPLPFISKGIGPIAVFPHQPETEALLSPLGDIVTVNSDKEISALAAITALMSPFYTHLEAIVKWSVANGLDPDTSARYILSFFEALCQKVKTDEHPADRISFLANEFTPGGLNEQAKQEIDKAKGYSAWTNALDSVIKRL